MRALDWFRNRKRGRAWPSLYLETKCSVVRTQGALFAIGNRPNHSEWCVYNLKFQHNYKVYVSRSFFQFNNHLVKRSLIETSLRERHFRLRNQSSACTRCKLFLHRAVRWSSECRVTYFLLYVVLVADDHNILFVQSISYEEMLNIKKELLDNIKRIVLIDSAMFVYKN